MNGHCVNMEEKAGRLPSQHGSLMASDTPATCYGSTGGCEPSRHTGMHEGPKLPMIRLLVLWPHHRASRTHTSFGV